MFKTKKICLLSKKSALLLCAISYLNTAEAEPLKVGIPSNINIPSQPLGNALKQFATQTGKNIIYDKTLVNGKVSPPVQGNYAELEALKRVLENSGLEAVQEDDTIVIRTARPKVEKKVENLDLDTVEVRAKRFYEIGPLPGLGLTKEEIPGNVQSISAKEIKEAHSLSLTDLMNRKLQSVTVNDYQGNPFQMDVQYRGFTAGPQIGTPQGLSVFLDGIRVNEPFGDVVNWDMLPMNALASVDVFPGSNPIFGLNTLGGSFVLKTKDGFNHSGTDVEILTGSFGRKQLQLEGGWNNGTFGLFAAGNFFLEDGWRENSPSKVNQFFTKASYRGDKLHLNLSTLLVGTNLVGNGLLPSEEFARDRNSVFTSPDKTTNRLQQFQLSGSYFVDDNFTITGQVYRRDSQRHQKASDVYTQYENTITGIIRSKVKNTLLDGEEYTCLYNSTNTYGLPDYYLYSVPHGSLGADPLFTDYFGNGILNVPPSFFLALNPDSFNAELPPEFANYAKATFANQKNQFAFNALVGFLQDSLTPPSPPNLPDNTPAYAFAQVPLNPTAGVQPTEIDANSIANFNYYVTKDSSGNPITDNYLLYLGARNTDNCLATKAKYGEDTNTNFTEIDPLTNQPKRIDGAAIGTQGVVEGIPTAQITNTNIDQITDGASIQFNWNLEHHKLMIGASIDSARADYSSGGMLALLDANRNAYLAPDKILEQFVAARQEINNNNFDGTSVTKSLYLSETWSPVDTFHLNGALRYNYTDVNNTLATRSVGASQRDLSQIIATADTYNVCINGVCPSTGLKLPDLSRLSNPAENEKFTYHSLNPSFGATWQVNKNLNVYSNWAQGTRVPSVIELGCALDKTLVPNGTSGSIYKSIAEGRSCNLPSTLSGDPYLPQIKATTYEVGMRGNFLDLQGIKGLEWNISVYRTDLKDDIYLISLPQNQSLFDSIGNTRRQGIETGVSGAYGKTRFKLNYSLTDATFQDTFVMASNDNSSAVSNDLYGTGDGSKAITVKPGNRMPGVSLHNLNASASYDITDKLTVGISAVAHSESYVRGNENNKHQQGVTSYRTFDIIDPVTSTSTQVTVPRQHTRNPGTVPGYMLFNFQTSYKLSKEWTATMLINNLFDKEYFSAGRLGRNPFSPSILGAIGPDGYNHNSNDWLSTNFIAPGAPRGVWFSLNWHFVPD